MENKYYTPSIEEFCIGFEYETIYLQDYDNWVKETLSQEDASYFFDSYIADASPLEFRVKYLDKEDVESLGFRNYMNSVNNAYKLNNIVIRIKGDYILIFRYDEYTIDELVFKGIIKNKSELKILLKQLNII